MHPVTKPGPGAKYDVYFKGRIFSQLLPLCSNILRAVYDLSATPFFLRGSGYEEGTLFPWVVSDFALIDAIECGKHLIK
jgi:hypothetical protein